MEAATAFTLYSASGTWWEEYDGFTVQPDTLGDYISGLVSSTPEDLKFWVRPHTKEELQAADMWPKDS